MERIHKTIDVDVPASRAYDEWSDLTHLPNFMKGVKEVRKIGPKRYHWEAEIGGELQEWDAEVTDEMPNERLAWRSVTGATNRGTVTFEEISQNKTRVGVELEYEPEGFWEKLGSAVGGVEHRVEGDLEQFKEHVEKGPGAT